MTRTTGGKELAVIGVVAMVILLAGCLSGGGGATPTPKVVTKTPVESPLIVSHSLVSGHEGIPEDSELLKPCVRTGTFYQGMQPAWHVAVIDPATGEKLTNETITDVHVETSTGQTVETSFHPDDNSWHGCYVISGDAEPGEVTYQIVIEAENYETIETTSNAFTVVERTE